MNIQYALIFMLCLGSITLSSQVFPNAHKKIKSDFTISGKVLDEDTGKPIMFASVALYTKEGILLSGAETNLEGEYTIHNVKKGEYFVEPSFIGYESKRITEIVHKDFFNLDLKLSKSEIVCIEIGCYRYKKPLIRQDDTTSGRTITAEDIRPTYSLNYSRHSVNKKKRKKKERKNRKDITEKPMTISPKKMANQEIKIEKKKLAIRLFPNPTSGHIYVDASTEIQKIHVLNMEGKIIGHIY